MGLSKRKKETKALDVTSGVIWKQMLQLMWPIFLGFALQQTYGISNSIIVGRFAGKTALGGIQVTMPLMDLAVSLCMGFGAGCGVIVGQYFGEKDDKNLHISSCTAMALSMVGGLIASALGMLSVRPLLELMGTPQELMGEAMNFGILYFGAFAFNIILNMGAAVMRAIGNSKTPSLIIGFTCILNILLDLLFVGVFQLESLGCGIATAISMFTGAAITLASLHRAKGPWKFDYSELRIDKKIASQMLKVGVPLGAQAASFSVSNMLVQSAVNSFGTNAITGWGLTLRFHGLVWMVADALAITVTAFCAQNFGAQHFDRMRKCVKVTYVFIFGGIGALALFLFIFVPQLSPIFINDPEVTEITTHMVRFTIPFIMFYSVADATSGAIRATGESVKPMMITIFSTCILRIGWVEVMLPHYHYIETIMISYPVSWFAAALMFMIYYKRGRWLEVAIQNKEQQIAELEDKTQLIEEAQTACTGL